MLDTMLKTPQGVRHDIAARAQANYHTKASAPCLSVPVFSKKVVQKIWICTIFVPLIPA